MKPMIALSLLFGAMIPWIAAGPFLVIESFHHSALSFGYIQVLVFVSFILGTQLVSRLIEKISIKKITKLSILLAFVGGLLSLVLSLLMRDHLFDVIFPMIIFAFGSGIGFPVFNRLAIEGSKESMGIKMAIFASFMGIQWIFGKYRD